MSKTIATIAAVLTTLVPASAFAQDQATTTPAAAAGGATVNASATTHVAPQVTAAASTPGSYGPEAGRKGISFGVPSGGGPTIGASYNLSDTASIRLDFGLDVQFAPAARFGMSVEAGYRMYIAKLGNLSPFIQPGVFLAKPAADTNFKNVSFALSGGVGAEYYFAQQFSISGITGLSLLTTASFNSVRIATGTTAVFANFYF
ncbi:MAG: hypothetical protein U0169_00020 [Polyangiaceae bacterium]